MNKLNATRRFLTALAVASALALVACGGGDSGGDSTTTSVSAAYTSVGAGMNRDQIEKVLGAPATARVDPTPDGGTYTVLKWTYSDGSTLQIILINGIIKSKVISKGDKTISSEVY